MSKKTIEIRICLNRNLDIVECKPQPQINIKVPNTGSNTTNNPFTNWTPSTGSFSNNTGSTNVNNVSTFVPSNIISSGNTKLVGNILGFKTPPKNLPDTSGLDIELKSRYQNIMKGFTGQVLGGAVYDERDKRDYSEKPQVNKEMLAAARKIDSEGTSKSVNFMLFHKHHLNDDDMYWLSSIFNTHTPKGLAVNMVDLSNNDIKLTRDHNLTYQDLPFFSFNSPYNTPRNILRLDLSNNQIGDEGAKLIADGLANGVFPITKMINLSGNKITDTGKGFIASAIQKMNQGIVITLETIKNASKETFKIGVKVMLSIAKNNGISTKEALTTEETIEHCKKGVLNVGKNIVWGVAKCFTKADTPIALYEMDGHSLLVNTTTNIVNPLKKPMQFICITQETMFSIVEEDFANCLTGLDSGFND